VAKSESGMLRPKGRIFIARAKVMDADEVRRAVARIAHEIVEHNRGLDDVVVIGLQRGGVPLAHRLVSALEVIEQGKVVPFGTIDVSFYRDDIGVRPVVNEKVTDLPFDIAGGLWCSSTTCCSQVGRSGPRWRHSWPTEEPGLCSLRSWSTGVIGNCRSGLTSWARTCPHDVGRLWMSPPMA